METKTTQEPVVIIDDFITRELAKVREDGRTNMLDVSGVQVIANDLECYALVMFCEDVKQLSQTQRGQVWMQALTRMAGSR